VASDLTTTAPGHDIVLYDGDCRLCRGAAGTLQRLIPGHRLKLASFREPEVLARFPGVSLERCVQAMQYVRHDGHVFQGAEAVVQALQHRWFGKLALVYYVPGLRQVTDALYKVVARYRFKIAGRACSDGACAVHFR
jgi:predicted DCC family thiol-disulfide oxidoreductase YuxK